MQLSLNSNILEALRFIMRDSSLEEHRVHAVLCVEEWHVTVDLSEKVDALMTFFEVRGVGG